MKKKVGKFGTNTSGITFDRSDKEFYNIQPGDWIIFTIEKILDKNKKVKYTKSHNHVAVA